MAKLTITQKHICYYLIRRSYGWNLTEAAISLNEFAAVCNTDRSWLVKQLKELLRKKVIIRIGTLDSTGVYSLNTSIDEWDRSCLDFKPA